MNETNGEHAEHTDEQIKEDLIFLLAAIVHTAGGELRIPRAALSGEEVAFTLIDEPEDDAYLLKTYVLPESEQ